MSTFRVTMQLAMHLARMFPSASKSEIEIFATNAAMGYDADDLTADQLVEIENRFMIHLTLIDDCRRQPDQYSQTSMNQRSETPRGSQSMDDLAERQPISQSMNDLAERQISTSSQHLDHHQQSRIVDILNNIQISFRKEENFKQMCNTIFKGVKYFIQDPSNLVYAMIPLKYDDLENDEGIFAQIQALCSEFEIDCDAKEKGAILTFSRNDPTYVTHVGLILEAFKKHKDESIMTKNTGNVEKKSYNPMDPNRDERVAAYHEAKRLRAITGPAPIAMFEYTGTTLPNKPSSTNPFDEDTEESLARQLDYPAPPSNQNVGQSSAQQEWDGKGQDPIANRFKYSINDKALTINPQLAHQNQLNKYRNKARFNNHSNIEARPKFMTYGQLSDKIDIEDQEVLGKECLEWTNKFRASHGLRPLLWEKRMFDIGRI
jgi:hypothetical protein